MTADGNVQQQDYITNRIQEYTTIALIVADQGTRIATEEYTVGIIVADQGTSTASVDKATVVYKVVYRIRKGE